MALYPELAYLLAERRARILALWAERTLRSYKSPDFFLRAQDIFANPVGMLIQEGQRQIFDLLCAEAGGEDFVRPLNQILRVRAVQEFAASQAVVPFLELRWIVREVLNEEPAIELPAGQMDEFACAVERVALTAFDLYCQCREALYRARIREVKSGRAPIADGGCPTRALAAWQEHDEKM